MERRTTRADELDKHALVLDRQSADLVSALLSRPVEWLLQAGRLVALSTIITCVALIGLADYLTGSDLNVSVFYILPVSVAAWAFGRRAGLLVGILCALVWAAQLMYTDFERVLAHPLTASWNTASRLITYSIIALMLGDIRRHYIHERRQARYDDLTGALQGRAFRDLLDLEIERARRLGRRLTLAYVDLDGFKALNDMHGHAAGDTALRGFAQAVGTVLGPFDHFARIGGDEFLLLLSERDHGNCRIAVETLHQQLADALATLGYPLTCSMGALLVDPDIVAAPYELVRRADDLMYQAKRAGKNQLRIGRSTDLIAGTMYRPQWMQAA